MEKLTLGYLIDNGIINLCELSGIYFTDKRDSWEVADVSCNDFDEWEEYDKAIDDNREQLYKFIDKYHDIEVNSINSDGAEDWDYLYIVLKGE